MSSFDTSQLVERGQNLLSDIHFFATRLSAASCNALAVVNPVVADTQLKESWPLGFGPAIERRIREMAVSSLHSVGNLAVTEATAIPKVFMGSKIYDNALTQAYGVEAPRKNFALDVVGWAERMGSEGWSLLARMVVLGRTRVEVEVYEDNEAARAYFDTLIAGNHLAQAEIAQGLQSHVRLSDRVIIDNPLL